MLVNPFTVSPKHLFRAKLLVPLVGVFFFGIVAMGVAADPRIFVPEPVKSSGLAPELPEFLQDASRGGLKHWRTVLYFTSHIPEVCWGDNAVNDFQRRQCDDFWHRLGMAWLLAFLPLALMLFTYRAAMDSLANVYKKARKRVDSGKALLSAMVTNPATAPQDGFSRIYCLRTIGVQLPDGKQMTVYVPLDVPLPTPGMKMAVFKPVTLLGVPRHFAVVYAPHVAIVSGVRHR